MPSTEVIFTREKSAAEIIERLIRQTKNTFDAALYRFNSRRLAEALDEAGRRGVRIHMVIDRNKYNESQATRQLLDDHRFTFRLARGRGGNGSKMHHKFALLDEKIVITGSYNWTFASEEENYENLLILRDPELVRTYRPEFELLWAQASPLNDED